MLGMPREIEPKCPAARVEATDKYGNPAIVCGIKERDEKRADRILEGTPTGVVVSPVDDASTFWGFCCGVDEPVDPEIAYARAEAGEARLPCTYSCCPIYAAAREWNEMQERLFGEPQRPETELVEEDGSVKVGEEAVEESDIRELIGL